MNKNGSIRARLAIGLAAVAIVAAACSSSGGASARAGGASRRARGAASSTRSASRTARGTGNGWREAAICSAKAQAAASGEVARSTSSTTTWTRPAS